MTLPAPTLRPPTHLITTKRRARAIAMVIGIGAAIAIAGCRSGERLSGPTVNVRNDSPSSVAVAVANISATIAAGQTQTAVVLPVQLLTGQETISVLDARTCATLGSAVVNFAANPDPLVVVGSDASVTVRELRAAEKASLAPAPSSEGGACSKSQTWSLLVVNKASTAFRLTMLPPDRGGVTPPAVAWFEAAPAARGSIRWGSVTSSAEGTIRLVDPSTCATLDEVTHPAVGEFLVTIEASGKLRIEPGPVPSDAPPLPGAIPRNPSASCGS